MMKSDYIRYAQCWEDPCTLTNALAITPEDDVLSIASGGENTFALLLKEPNSITALDSNVAQLYLVELKMKAIQVLDYDDFLGFVGVRAIDNRFELYKSIKAEMSSEARAFWDGNTGLIREGIIHVGRLERYFKIFRRMILPLVHSEKTVKQLLRCSTLEQQREFYEKVWGSRRWHWLYRLFFSKFLLGRLGRDPSLFDHVKVDDIADILLERCSDGLTRVSIRDNYFLEYILTGCFSDPNKSHPWLQKKAFQKLKNSINQVQLVNADLNVFLNSQAKNSITKFNLSDVFEYMSAEKYEESLYKLVRIGRPGARLAFWTLFVPRDLTRLHCDKLISQQKKSEDLFERDRTFFYGSFIVMDIN